MQHTETGENAVSIWLTGETLPSCAGDVTRLVQDARRAAGLPPWREVEADCFQAGDSLLILARPAQPRRKGFFFPDLETLLAAAFSCRSPDSALYIWDGGYLLTLPPEDVSSVHHEFGTPFPLHPHEETHAHEQGLCLFPRNAAGELRRLFSTDRM